MGVKSTMKGVFTKAGFFSKIKDEERAKTATNLDRYHAGIRALVDRGLNNEEAADLQGCAEILGISVEQVEADSGIVEKFREAEPLAADADKRVTAAKDAGRARDQHAADVAQIRIEQDRKQQALTDEVALAQRAATEALQARERMNDLARRHHDLLGVQPPSPAPAAASTNKAPSSSGTRLEDLAEPRRVYTAEETAAIQQRNEARRAASVAPSGTSEQQLQANTRVHETLLAKSAPPAKKPVPTLDTEPNDAHALATGRALAGRA